MPQIPASDPHDDPLHPLIEEAHRLHLELDGSIRAALARYLALVLEWNRRAGLTSLTEPAEVLRRHFGESLALLALLRSSGIMPAGSHCRVADLGPGGGFPGLPIRIVEPAIDLTLIESNQRRVEFLRHVVRELALDRVEVVAARAEDAGRDPALRVGFDLVIARALAAMPVLVEYALPLLRDGGLLVAPKGSRALDELDEASVAIQALGGVTHDPLPLPLAPNVPGQTVLLVRRTGELDGRYPRRAGIPAKRPLR